mmetsp:Transcript_35546/g.104075  ORF Transcript_35546/g.104075 Transcript_35546/m.104075 type:complete len:102 (+) Transcript_35546:451-756(+)
MAHVYVPDSTSKAEQDRLRELLQVMQDGVQQHNTYVNDFVQTYEQTGGKATHAKIVINSDARPAPSEGDTVMSSHKRRYNAPQRRIVVVCLVHSTTVRCQC